MGAEENKTIEKARIYRTFPSAVRVSEVLGLKSELTYLGLFSLRVFLHILL